MNALQNFMPQSDAVQTMSSREIAELVEKRHDNVKRTIETLSQSGVISLPQIEEVKIQRERRMETASVYVFSGDQGKRDSIIVVAQLCPEFTARLVDRWAELEAKQKIDPMVALSDPATLRSLLTNYSEKVIELEGVVEDMRPQVQALDRIAQSEGSMCITDAAKTLQLRPKVLFDFLHQHHWIYSRQGDGTKIAYQAKLQQGVLEHKTTVVTRSDGSEKTTTQVRVTSKGLTVLGKLFPDPLKIV